MNTSGTILWQGEGDAQTGVWECTAGPSRWLLDTNEFVHIVAGSMTITPDDGSPALVGPGDTFFVPKGWSGTWDIHETVRKLYVIF
ncbi:DUF861 domain-containing protein [Leekyejoonella antrihumi]|uniref:DUF861 domain-containing protein n=2 Tax=Leekyejoonella antrihumi TaxID=1660198 RepID=A0A563DQS0_9MICO|nr:DUF861 domain-containing protein [Leekyejoonella antrihumi]